jgi:hypothetical protein
VHVCVLPDGQALHPAVSFGVAYPVHGAAPPEEEDDDEPPDDEELPPDEEEDDDEASAVSAGGFVDGSGDGVSVVVDAGSVGDVSDEGSIVVVPAAQAATSAGTRTAARRRSERLSGLGCTEGGESVARRRGGRTSRPRLKHPRQKGPRY